MRIAIGLAAALAAARFLCPIPPHHRLSSSAIIAGALGYVALIAIAAIISTQLLRGHFPVAMRCAAAAVWAAPLAIFATEQSAWAAIPLVFFVTLATPLFGLNREAPAQSSDFHLLRQLPSSFGVAVLIQCAAVAALIHQATVSGILLSAGAAMLAWRATAIDPQPRARARRVLFLTTLAVVFTIFGMLPYHTARVGLAGGGKVTGSGDPDRTDGRDGSGITADSYRGVILLPELQRRVTLVPPLPALRRDPFRENKKDLEIPFYGVYWLFRRPDTRPPKDAIELRGKPSELAFRSHDSRPLIMEAHQNLGTQFNVSCCSAVQLSITNRNRYPGTVSIELILVNTFADSKPFQSLGMLPVQSVFGMNSAGPGVNEVLDYPIPQTASIRQFDEFTIRFHRPFLLAKESSNVSIDGFKLKPR